MVADGSCAFWSCGTSCISMINRQSPMAVIMVAGRVCKCGVGGRLLVELVMGTLPEGRNKDVIEKSGQDPKYAVDPAKRIYRPVTEKSQAKSCNANAVKEEAEILLHNGATHLERSGVIPNGARDLSPAPTRDPSLRSG